MQSNQGQNGLPISSRSNRNGPQQFQTQKSKNSRNNLANGQKIPTPKNNQAWNNDQNTMDFQIKKNSRNYGNFKDIYRGGNNQQQKGPMQNVQNQHQGQLQINPNINSYREVNFSDIRSPQPTQLPMNEFAIPNIGAFPQSVTNASAVGGGLVATGQTPKRNLQMNNIKFNMQQFPPVNGNGQNTIQAPEQSGYSAHVIKARQSVGKRSQNRTINENPKG